MKIILSLVCLLITYAGFAQTTLYISAKSGISLREKPSTSAAIISKLNYAEKIELVGMEPETVIIEGFTSQWAKVTSGQNTGYIVSVFTLPFPPPKTGTSEFDTYFKQIATVAGHYSSEKKPADEYATIYAKALFSNGAERWNMQAVDDMETTIILPGCNIAQAFQLLRLINEFGPIIKPSDNFPITETTSHSDLGSTAIKLMYEKDENTGKQIISKLRIERTEGIIESLEIFLLNGNAVINYIAAA